jgi:hypothetical protein
MGQSSGLAAFQNTNFFDLSGAGTAAALLATNNFGNSVAVNMTNQGNNITAGVVITTNITGIPNKTYVLSTGWGIAVRGYAEAQASLTASPRRASGLTRMKNEAKAETRRRPALHGFESRRKKQLHLRLN